MDGKPGRMPRMCTLDYKIQQMQKFVRWCLLAYKKGTWTRKEDIKAHTFHLGFSYEERRRKRENSHDMFENAYPLIDMGWTRADTYTYNRDIWGLDSKASACLFCPYHRNYFFWNTKQHYPAQYEELTIFDHLLESRQPTTRIKSKLYISRSRVRIPELCAGDCDDAETFLYQGQPVWNGF